MALISQASPHVQLKEIDLSGTVPAVTSTTGAFVGDFAWGPVGEPVLVGDESELVSKFGSPKDGSDSKDFLAVAQFLKYSGSAFVTRINGGLAASDDVVSAKYGGTKGNDISVVVSGSSPDLKIVVSYDGAEVESFDFLTDVVGDERYALEYVNRRSTWISISDIPAAGTYDLADGTDVSGNVLDAIETSFGDVDQIQIDFICAHNVPNAQISNVVQIAENRMDCVVVASPDTAPANATDVTTWASSKPSSSYLIMDGNWVQVYNKYEDKYEMIPACSSTAGIMAASDLDSAPWFSPAGTRRGQYFGVSALSFNPTKSDRNAMYEARVNPIVSMPGQGTVLFGDKTALSRPSAFDRINVRRLFLVIERAIGEAAKQVLFELNDDFTRAEFTNIVEPFLREIQGRRGITDFRVVCDETNNTPQIIDQNQFIASVFIKPARSINYVTLNFVAVRTGVEFEEVVGTV
jgi:hypothetical protein